ncbi:MAG TPA: hypothetical protein ENG48_02720 [Candidatus Atribacteria bacterium]|nr:hypothetical protein [Candidatus Atribacteria bacterium]
MADIDVVMYEVKSEKLNKREQLQILRKLGFKVVSFCEIPMESARPEVFTKRLTELRKISPYLMDGLVLDVNDINKRLSLGFETHSINPKYARAWKVRTTEDEYITTVEEVEWSVSKNGLVKPRVRFRHVDIKGVGVNFATGKNARTIQEMGIGAGAIIKVTRSGDTIPDILETIKVVSTPDIPVSCPSCNRVLEWTVNSKKKKVDLICKNEDCPGRVQKRILAFFRTIGIKGLNKGTVDKCIKSGFDSIEKILAMTVEDFQKLEGIKIKSATKLYSAIKKACITVKLSKLMHATGFFGRSLGSTKLENVIEVFGDSGVLELAILHIDAINNVVYSKVPGFKETALTFAYGIKKFAPWYRENAHYFKHEIKNSIIEVGGSSDKLNGYIIVFTKFRDKKLEEIIRTNGGYVKSNVSKKTSIVVTTDPYGSSSKLQKARSYGIEIQSRDEFIKWLNDILIFKKF